MQETWVWSLGQEDPLEKETATHSSTLAWDIPWTEEPGGLQSTGSRKERDATEQLINNNKAQTMERRTVLGVWDWVLWTGINHSLSHFFPFIKWINNLQGDDSINLHGFWLNFPPISWKSLGNCWLNITCLSAPCTGKPALTHLSCLYSRVSRNTSFQYFFHCAVVICLHTIFPTRHVLLKGRSHILLTSPVPSWVMNGQRNWVVMKY